VLGELVAEQRIGMCILATAIPLGIAFLFARKHQSRRFTFGYGRVEDLGGLAVLLSIFSSAVVAG